MGSSFVEYNGHGFWSWDGYLEHLSFLLAEAIGPSRMSRGWTGLETIGNSSPSVSSEDEFIRSSMNM